ncbi:hypothetical protein [Parvicella tangerina]|uniref:Uncharacterized protein n=1 Tax=Parvicella tangerina TaxID=2829795 RepID=A0A916JRZ6_9FLAO|nr:hypothetical protein [Parvicella tangerina]CAG5086516.1 hypothetical protein CRYO30217_03154 [Parvicella tangerina]
MNKLFTFLTLSLVALTSFAETVKLKITYNGSGISGHTVYVMIGGGVLGSGVTDSYGEVSVNVSSLPTKSIDIKGEKICNNAEKSWEVKGYVTLDGSNYAHLKMEEPIAEMVEASGGFMSESTLVASYGLVCSGSSGSSSSSSSSSGTADNTSNNTGSTGVSSTPLMTREESLESQKMMLENRLSNLDNKISKSQSKIDEGKVEGKKKEDEMYDIMEWEVEKKITSNKLDKVNLQMDKGMLNKSERQMFKENEKAYEEELDEIKEDRKKGVSLLSEEEKAEALEVTDAEMADMSNLQLKKKRLDYKSKLGKLKLKLKTKKKFMSPNEVEELEAQIADIEKSIEVMEAEIEKRNE